MGCGGSAAPAPSASGPSESGAPPVSLQYREITSIIDMKISGVFNKDMAATPQETGALFQHVKKAADEGLALVAAYPKVEMPEMPGAGAMMGMSVGAATTIEIKSTLATWFVPVPSGTALSTVLVYAPLNVDASIGFLNTKITNIEDGVTGTVHSYAAQGYELVGMGIAGGATTTKFMSGANSSSLAELVFQRPEPSKPSTISITQNAIKVSMNMGQMKSVVPDFIPFLNEMGAEGFQLSGFLMPPQAPPQAGVMSFNMDMPVQTIMRKERDTTKKYKYCNATFYYKINIMTATIEGDPSGLIQSYASKGWTLKAILSIPAEKDGMMGMKIPSKLFFVAEQDSEPI